MSELRLQPFEREQLGPVETWFDDPDTLRWLGGRGWPRLVMDLAERPLGEHRGAVETGRYGWTAWDRDELIGYIDCGTTDVGPRGNAVRTVKVSSPRSLWRRATSPMSSTQLCAAEVTARP
jgi:hypothetical protein